MFYVWKNQNKQDYVKDIWLWKHLVNYYEMKLVTESNLGKNYANKIWNRNASVIDYYGKKSWWI